MNSVETLEYYQKKSGYKKISDKELETALDRILRDLGTEHSDEEKLRLRELLIQTTNEYKKNLPTEYQDVNTYILLDTLFNKINESAKKISGDSKFIFPDKIIYGTVNINKFTALVKNTDTSNDDYLLLVSDCMFMFANLLAKSIGMLMINNYEDDEGELFKFDISKDNISTSINYNFDAIIRFTDLILAYIVTGQAANAQQYTPNKKLESITCLIREAYELFVVGHEYSHVLLGHITNKDNSKNEVNEEVKIADEIIEQVISNWKEEHEADLQAAVLAINAMEEYDFATSYMGVDVCLITLVILERIDSLLGIESQKTFSHPPAEERRTFIYNVLSKKGEEIKDIYDANTYIVDLLWNRCMYIIVEIKRFLKETFNMQITDIHYDITRDLLYKFGTIFLHKYNEEHK